MEKRILLIGAGNEGLDIIKKAKDYNLSILNINNHKNFRDVFSPFLDEIVIIDYQNIEKTVKYAQFMYNISPFDAVIALSEAALVPAAYVSEALGFKGNSVKSVLALKNKLLMRETLDNASVSPVSFQKIESIQSMEQFAAKVGFPLIIKPIDGSGSERIYTINTYSDLSIVYEKLNSPGKNNFQQYIMESYLNGPEISVEAFTFNGRHIVIAITDKFTTNNHIEIGHVVPAKLSNIFKEEIINLTIKFLDTIGINSGPTHTEIKLTSEGPRIVESHNRVGGDRINELVKQAYGIDMRALTIGWAIGQEKEIISPPTVKNAAAIKFITAKPGVVSHVTISDEIIKNDTIVEYQVKVKKGDIIEPLTSSKERIGYIIAVGNTWEEAKENAEKYAKLITISVIDK